MFVFVLLFMSVFAAIILSPLAVYLVFVDLPLATEPLILALVRHTNS